MTTPDITSIPAPRVAFIDPQTGLISREWYMFLLNLFTLTGAGTTDLTVLDLAVAPVEVQVIPPDTYEVSPPVVQNIVADELGVAPIAMVPYVDPNSQLSILTSQMDQLASEVQAALLAPPSDGGGGGSVPSGSQIANTFYAAPNGSAGIPSFRAMVNADLPTAIAVTTLQAGSGSTTSAGFILGYGARSGYGAIWSTGVTPSVSNYSFATNGAESSINASTTIYGLVNNTTVWYANSGGVYVVPNLQVGSGSTTLAGLITGYGSRSGYGAIWSTCVSPSVSNYSFASNGAETAINASTTIYGLVNNATAWSATSSGMAVANGFGCNTKSAQAAYASGGAVAATGSTNIAPYGYTTAAQADGIVTLLNNIRAALVANGIMS